MFLKQNMLFFGINVNSFDKNMINVVKTVPVIITMGLTELI